MLLFSAVQLAGDPFDELQFESDPELTIPSPALPFCRTLLGEGQLYAESVIKVPAAMDEPGKGPAWGGSVGKAESRKAGLSLRQAERRMIWRWGRPAITPCTPSPYAMQPDRSSSTRPEAYTCTGRFQISMCRLAIAPWTPFPYAMHPDKSSTTRPEARTGINQFQTPSPYVMHPTNPAPPDLKHMHALVGSRSLYAMQKGCRYYATRQTSICHAERSYMPCTQTDPASLGLKYPHALVKSKSLHAMQRGYAIYSPCTLTNPARPDLKHTHVLLDSRSLHAMQRNCNDHASRQMQQKKYLCINRLQMSYDAVHLSRHVPSRTGTTRMHESLQGARCF